MSRSSSRPGPAHRPRWTRWWVLSATLALVLGALTAPAAEAHRAHHRHGNPATSGEAVRGWNEIAVNTLIALPGPAGGAPPAAAVHVAMVQGAVYDAVNAVSPRRYRPYLLHRRFSTRASTDAAVAAAAYGVLGHLVSSVPNVDDPVRAATLATLATQYADALADVPDGTAERTGVAAGRAAARTMIRARADDGRFGPSPWVPNPAPGHWTPQTNPATGQPVLDPTPWVGAVDPFVLRSPSQFRTTGPLPLRSARYAAELNEVKALGRKDAPETVRSQHRTYVARWWQSTPSRSWNEVGRELSARFGLGALDTARLLALQDLSAADAAIGCWNDKYHWDFWRPWNAIPRADEDGNPATSPDPTWQPLISAPYPEHPSGHLCLDGAHARILRMFFGDDPDGFSITSVSALLQPTDVAVRHFDRFSQVLAEIVEARIWAGLHFRNADEQGKRLGLHVAGYVASHALQPTHHHR